MNKNNAHRLRKLVIVLFSAFLYGLAMNIFVESGNLFPGGFSGISRLISQSADKFLGWNIPFGVVYFLLNIVATVFVFRVIGKWFTIYSVIWFSAASFFSSVLPNFTLTQDPLLISIFGGLMGGFALGLSLRQDASSGGMDFLAIYASTRFNVPTWNYVLGLNCIVLAIAGSLFGWNQALYSIIYQFCSTQVVNTLHDRYKIKTLFIITERPDLVSAKVFSTCRHGITRFDVVGEFSKTRKSMLYMAINAYQIHDVLNAVLESDPRAFIDVFTSDRIIGNYYQKPLD